MVTSAWSHLRNLGETSRDLGVKVPLHFRFEKRGEPGGARWPVRKETSHHMVCNPAIPDDSSAF